jgi:hypothetical protein
VIIVQCGTDHSCPKRYKPLGDQCMSFVLNLEADQTRSLVMIECMMFLQSSVGRVIIGALRLASLTKI